MSTIPRPDDPRTAVGDEFSAFLGMHWADDERLALEIRPPLINPGGRLLGPVGFALVDYGMGAVLFEQVSEHETIATVNIAINYMDSAAEGFVFCTSRVDRRTRGMAWVTSDVHHEDGRLLYTAIGTFAILANRTSG